MIKVLVKHLNKDKDYRHGWQSNIAMSFVDEMRRSGKRSPSYQDLLKIANNAADNFLKRLEDA